MLFDESRSAPAPELGRQALNVVEDIAFRSMTMIVVIHKMDFAC